MGHLLHLHGVSLCFTSLGHGIITQRALQVLGKLDSR